MMNVFKQLLKSCYSPKDISMFRFQGIGKTILYVFLLTLISILPSIYYFSTAITEGVSSAKETVKQEFPDFVIKNGQLKSDMKEPLTINQNGFVIIFDSSGKANVDDLKNIANGVGFLKNDLVFVAGGQTQSYSYSMAQDLSVNKTELMDLIDNIDSSLIIFLPILFIVIYIFSSGIKFIEISILALFGLLLKNMSERKLEYRHLWRMSAYSVTLPTLFFMIMDALKTVVPAGFLIHWFVAFIVLFLAIKEIPQMKK
jgi:maltodextrin utilization protein YvdJ